MWYIFSRCFRALLSRGLWVCLLSVSFLSGCGLETALFASGAATGVIISDPRGPGGILQDQTIEHKVHVKWQRDPGVQLGQSHIYAVSINRRVILLGQAVDSATRVRAAVLAGQVPKVKRIFNYMTVGAPSTLSLRSRDAWITTQVKSRLLAKLPKHVLKIKVVTEAGTVFLFGLLTRRYASDAARIASRVPGVVRVVKVFEYVRYVPPTIASTP